MDIDALAHEQHMERALALARDAGDRGDEPFGSVLVRDGDIVMEAANAVNSDDDLRRHPELTLAQRAASEFTREECRETVMYTSTEPCAMCSGGIYIAKLGGVVYSVSAERAGEVANNDLVVPSADIFERGSVSIPVVGPVLPDEGEQIHAEWW